MNNLFYLRSFLNFRLSDMAKIIGTNSQFINSTFKVTSGGVWIENLTISNKKAERINAWGIYVNGAVGVKIINNTITVFFNHFD